MHLDVQTLSVVTVFVTVLLGALLVFAGLQNRTIRAPMWRGAAHVVNASGLAFLTSQGAAARRILRRQYRGNFSVLFQEKAAPLFGSFAGKPATNATRLAKPKQQTFSAHRASMIRTYP